MHILNYSNSDLFLPYHYLFPAYYLTQICIMALFKQTWQRALKMATVCLCETLVSKRVNPEQHRKLYRHVNLRSHTQDSKLYIFL